MYVGLWIKSVFIILINGLDYTIIRRDINETFFTIIMKLIHITCCVPCKNIDNFFFMLCLVTELVSIRYSKQNERAKLNNVSMCPILRNQ